LKQNWQERHTRNAAFGTIVGFTSGMVIAWAYDSQILIELQKFYTFIASAILSLIAATLTLLGVFANLNQQREQEDERRVRRFKSALAVLPQALSVTLSVSQRGIIFSETLDEVDQILEGKPNQTDIENLELPSEIITVFRDVIEFSDDEKAVNRLVALLSEHQLLMAKLQSDLRMGVPLMALPELHKAERTAGWAFLAIISTSMFQFARGETHNLEQVDASKLLEMELWRAQIGLRESHELKEAITIQSKRFDKKFQQ